jgi:superfamily II DNA or RNA helicase
MTRKPPFQYVNIHGLPIQVGRTRAAAEPPQERQDQAESDKATQERARKLDPADVQAVGDALCLAGWRRGRTALTALLAGLGWRRADGAAFSLPDTGAALQRLVQEGRAHTPPGEGVVARPELVRERLPLLLARPEATTWWRVWVWVANGAHGSFRPEQTLPYYISLKDGDEALALARLYLVSGNDAAHFNRLRDGSLGRAATAPTLARAAAELCDMGLLPRVNPALLWPLLAMVDSQGQLSGQPSLLDWLAKQVEAQSSALPASLRLRVAEGQLHSGQADGMRRALAGSPALEAFVPVFEAARLAWEGRFAESVQAFAPALKQLASVTGRRRNLVPQRLLQWYTLALLAQPDPALWTIARKLCVAESGSRQPSVHDAWGRWAHAVAVRLGDAPIEPATFEPPRTLPPGYLPQPVDANHLADRVLLATWLDHPSRGWTPDQLQTLSDQLHQDGLHWKADLLGQACERSGQPQPVRPASAPPLWTVRYFGPAQALWRDALAAIVALGAQGEAGGTASQAPVPTLVWRLTLDDENRVHDLQALEPSASGRGKPKPLSLNALKKRSRLDPRDAAVARCVRQSQIMRRDLALDLVQATQALVGHPGLELAETPGVTLDLREGLPVLEVLRQRQAPASGQAADGTATAAPPECFVFRLQDELLCADPPELTHHSLYDDDDRAEAERRNSLRVVLDAPERARLIRISPAQRRVAELVSKRWTVPVDAQAELDAALRVLAGHFVLHSDAEAGEPVPADARLVVQLQPRGDGLQLQVAVRPFGDYGPVLVPGSGRTRLMTLHGGLSLATTRNMATEGTHLAALLDALPLLGEAPPDATWLLADPEAALAVVHALGPDGALTQTAGAPVRAVEWPKGKPLRVLTPTADALKMQLKSGRDWFALEGELQLDEGRVLSLQQVLSLLRESRGQRFVALGDGQYLALAEQLRQRLADLDALADADGKSIRLAHTTAAWLADAAEDLGLRGDTRWRERASRLEQAAALDLAVPPGLQAQLRPYQAEGWLWMARLAHAGFGACLADDMGLGKTVQTLALLLHRAADGPALVLAPTSVCSNWAAEAARFAPGLRVTVYGMEGERSAQLQQAAAGDVLIVSYALLVGEADAFAQREWATLVLDEAQALKNAATQRVKAVGALQASFKLALSGTPVENRLADLWSIMALLNPGLLGNANRFAERFANPIERQRNDAARSRLRRLVSPFLLRRTKAQVLPDLPPRTEIVHRIEPSPEERAFLEAMRREALARVAAIDPADSRSAFNVLAELTRLRRAACDPRLASPELGLVGAKAQAFEQLARELVEGRHQALVFSQFTDFLKLLAQRLDAAGLRYQYLDGSTPAAARAERVSAFQRGEAELFLISLKAGGFGLNLTAADYVVIADPWWNPAAEDQAMGRAHRIGQLRPVTVYRLVTAGSVEERIVALHHDKRELADGLLAGQDGGAPLKADELMDLLKA